MRTKTMLLSAAVMAAGALSSMAQSSVYSLNVVGYVNVTLYGSDVEGSELSMIANPLDVDGTGTNNVLDTVLGTGLPTGTTIFPWTPTGFGGAISYNGGKGGWSDGGTALLNPGQGVFVQLPPGSSTMTVSLVGNVLQGTVANNYITGTASLVSSVIPVSGAIDGAGNGGLNYVPNTGDTIFAWDPNQNTGFGGYDGYVYNGGKGGWAVTDPSNTNAPDPVIAPGQAFFLISSSTPTWTQSFTVQ